MKEETGPHLGRQEARIIARLRFAQANGKPGCYGHELVEHCCHRFGARIFGLRKKRYVISKKRIEANVFLYTLEQEPHTIDTTAPERPAPYVIPEAAGQQGRLFA